MASSNSLALIEKLTGRDNYATWRFAVKTYLQHEELWDCVEYPAGTEIDKKRDTKAKSKIILLVDPVNYVHIQEASTAKEVWENLSRAFDDSGLTRRVGLLRDLCNTTLSGCPNVEEYVSKIMTTAHKLRNIGFHVDDEWLGTMLLSGLPESYMPMIIALESSGIKITSDAVKSKILQDVKQTDDNTAFATSQRFQNKNKFSSKGPRCYTCNKYGHKSPQCKSKGKKPQQQHANKQATQENNSSYAAVFVAASDYTNAWYIDSGASVHMTKCKDLLQEVTVPTIKTIKVADGKTLPVECSGQISLNVYNAKNENFLTFLDDYSKKIFVYTLSYKTEVLEKFKEFKSQVENTLDCRIKVLRTDYGLEYVNRPFTNYMKGAGIIHQTTTPYSPEQNGAAERMNRTLVERAKCMLLNANLPKHYWAEAIHTAAYTINRSPTRSLSFKTPEEMWSGQKPNVSHMRTFGCDAMVHLPKEKRKKWDSKAQKMIFIGYCENSKGYRFILPNSKTVVKSRDAVFLESTVKRNYVPVEISPPDVPADVQHKPETESKDESLVADESYETVTDSHSDSEYLPEESIDSIPERNITLRSRNKQKNTENTYLCCDEEFFSSEVPETYKQALNSSDAEKWQASINEELEAHKKNNTWTLVEKPPNVNVIGCKWVFRIKEEPTGPRFKSRLCAKGYAQTKGIDYKETFAPTVRYDSIRILLSEAAQYNLETIQLDIKTAFLYGELEEDIYMSVPEGISCKEKQVCKLNKSLYGLKQSPRCWNSKFDSVLKKFGLVNSKADQCVYVGQRGGEKCYFCLYVDDGLIFSKSKSVLQGIVNDLQQVFELKTCPVNNYVGMEIEKTEKQIFIHQGKYIQKLLNRFNLTNANPNSVPADPSIKLEKEDNEPA
ncbi:hypothetical protein ABMA27_000825 [Loxostege sticticalis]|uniref:Retrovirus-related Pol polyprotein from transposon TNT 1-94 n=1 Tax=Loxostege sticticalis TaxID=481309 RepID=A0ABR3I0F6_LOXSC